MIKVNGNFAYTFGKLTLFSGASSTSVLSPPPPPPPPPIST